MNEDAAGGESTRVIATIRNQQNPDQAIDLVYLPEENGFATSGIQTHFDLPEILIPAHMVAQDLQLIGAIVSAVLERISQAAEKDGTFEYASRFEVMGREYTFTPQGAYMKLETREGNPDWLEGEVE